MNYYPTFLLCVSTVVLFLIAIALFIYVFVKDSQLTDTEDRDTADRVWIAVFFIILLLGLLISIICCYNTSPKSNICASKKFKNIICYLKKNATF